MNDDAAHHRTESNGDEASDLASEANESTPAASEIEVLRSELAEARDDYLRLAAELDNVRKRSARDVENAHRYGIEKFAAALLPVIDSFEAGLAVEHSTLEALLDGQRATLRLLEQAFAESGIQTIDPHGEPFDPKVHEAISLMPMPHAEPDSIVDVVQKGYTLQQRLLRPARVVVAQAPPKDE